MQNQTKTKICLTGLTACGKTTLLQRLSRHYKCPYVSFSTFLIKEYAATKPNLISKHKKSDHYWRHAKSLNDYRLKSQTIEKQIDKKFYDFIESKDKIVFDSFSYPYFAERNPTRSFCVFIRAKQNIRVRRAFRSSQSLKGDILIKYIKEKDRITSEVLKKCWNFNIFQSSYMRLFDLIIDDGELEKKKVDFKRRMDVKSEIVTSFADLWLCRKSGKISKEKALLKECLCVTKKYYPVIIKKHPRLYQK
ncbi:hypothetical protein A3I34_01735 [Candidatus Jorgensenbacteria bacterium RIFCSPLOWO2_02_FULL_45_12]|uniref:NadR/Ttd14 AAA domain-containing protein n=2 Tax=Candidatus Joergenseniibacteriota TaxID=1752739 RepID=A0A1F6BNI1_9BACT|nr:MAG: hypothetical protein UX22_C0004G0011 [Candidatus Jorgensenbacteria bacterium GW2011_GWA2_45_9]OGG38486.1 MAG: hypothetical protein A3D55_02145 [Candidatus Jorgensenbacteria bacterium RIFCSPHIGHO2_02_FULL_45_20]OGG42318.1 MAG: hypothetical protein A3I34_01735 [Candidatus Jorgensenbacteria bacterium RIFCSPLOWO2_02_FULL_45_12]